MAFGVLQRVTQALLPEAVTPAGLLAQCREGRASQTESPGPPPVPLPAHPLLVATQKLSKNYNPVPNGVCLEATHEKETRTLRITASSHRSRDRAEDKGRLNGPPCAGAGPAAGSIRGHPPSASRPTAGGSSVVFPGAHVSRLSGAGLRGPLSMPLSADTARDHQE